MSRLHSLCRAASQGGTASRRGKRWDRLDDGILGQADGHVYDGHVALVLDPGFLSGMDSTLDLLTTSTDLFDVPAMDVDGTWNDATSA